MKKSESIQVNATINAATAATVANAINHDSTTNTTQAVTANVQTTMLTPEAAATTTFEAVVKQIKDSLLTANCINVLNTKEHTISLASQRVYGVKINANGEVVKVYEFSPRCKDYSKGMRKVICGLLSAENARLYAAKTMLVRINGAANNKTKIAKIFGLSRTDVINAVKAENISLPRLDVDSLGTCQAIFVTNKECQIIEKSFVIYGVSYRDTLNSFIRRQIISSNIANGVNASINFADTKINDKVTAILMNEKALMRINSEAKRNLYAAISKMSDSAK